MSRTVGLPDEMLKDENTLFGAPKGWQRADRHVYAGIVFVHGDGYSGREAHIKAAIAHRAPTVIGHVHAHAGVAHLQGPLNRIWALNAGCLIDPAAAAFDYAKHSPNRPTLGAGLVLDGVPHFVPYSC